MTRRSSAITFDLEFDPDWRNARRELSSITDLADDWDGLGATAPNPEIVRTAEGLLRVLQTKRASPPSAVSASPRGAVVFVWQIVGTYIEIEISDPLRFTLMVEHQDGRIESRDLQIPSERLRRSRNQAEEGWQEELNTSELASVG